MRGNITKRGKNSWQLKFIPPSTVSASNVMQQSGRSRSQGVTIRTSMRRQEPEARPKRGKYPLAAKGRGG
jgi:hypothetical protein